MRPLCAGVSGDGNPVGWVERSDTHQGRWVERWVSLRSTHPTTDAHSRSRGADSARGLLEILPLSKIEGAGKTGCALHPRSRVQSAQRTRTRAYRFSGEHPAFPAQWFYGLYRALPGERLSCHRRRAKFETLRNLTPDHTTSPYAIGHARQSWPPRPPHLTATFVTIASRPSLG